ncbi:MSMEG_1061 family FMN-dependent PPOX-type flavoprotein [Neptunomonas qingdaonensis]|uniref:Pyridoxamine 5'-phosphate oxidase N-terminal domain-containing protein n=1 Tax=Neptunomonas qingdaonensis TaxID=1045558 RepID=A0A1I2SDU9_9GAMM|nr:MSMEG_1061 family FMN-dependent PPOX-type flavoprotein [Neptunomonas qingdaonensis]SFG49107.1 hypothetical protein SAMN05216175_107160 [Neptunomonas qingdaonensis]
MEELKMMDEIKSQSEVREAIGEPSPFTRKKIYDHLNVRMQAFIRTSPLAMLATVDDAGFPTISPKGDKAGFIQIKDDKTLLLPELKGNKLAFSLTNIVSSSNKVGLIFLRPGTAETLRVHGTCRLFRGHDICTSVAGSTHQALLVLEIEVSNAYFHCGKALLRSKAWDADHHEAPLEVSFGKEIAENTDATEALIREIDEGVQSRYITDL